MNKYKLVLPIYFTNLALFRIKLFGKKVIAFKEIETICLLKKDQFIKLGSVNKKISSINEEVIIGESEEIKTIITLYEHDIETERYILKSILNEMREKFSELSERLHREGWLLEDNGAEQMLYGLPKVLRVFPKAPPPPPMPKCKPPREDGYRPTDKLDTSKIPSGGSAVPSSIQCPCNNAPHNKTL